jgi:hypothetical protein
MSAWMIFRMFLWHLLFMFDAAECQVNTRLYHVRLRDFVLKVFFTFIEIVQNGVIESFGWGSWA